jgi:hypothetical protein
MKPKNEFFKAQKSGLFTNIGELINTSHPLVALADALDWDRFDEAFRNFLKGVDGDHFNALLAGSGKNMAKLLALIALNPILFKAFITGAA